MGLGRGEGVFEPMGLGRGEGVFEPMGLGRGEGVFEPMGLGRGEGVFESMGLGAGFWPVPDSVTPPGRGELPEEDFFNASVRGDCPMEGKCIEKRAQHSASIVHAPISVSVPFSFSHLRSCCSRTKIVTKATTSPPAAAASQ